MASGRLSGRHAHSVHGATNFASSFVGRKPAPLDVPTPTLSSGKKIFFVRHGEGEHNVASASGNQAAYLIADAQLSSKGVEQSMKLMQHPAFCSASGHMCVPELLVVSPLRRTMLTAILGFNSDTPIILRPDMQENGLTPADCAQPDLGIEMLRKQGRTSLCDMYESLPEDWHIKGSLWKRSVSQRFATILEWLETRPEQSIVVVGHHDFFRCTLNESFENAEVRQYTLDGGILRDMHGKDVMSKTRISLAGLLMSGIRSPTSSGSRSPMNSGSLSLSHSVERNLNNMSATGVRSSKSMVRVMTTPGRLDMLSKTSAP
uniref:Uncharacterized protein n=1 Tax=Haptolina brevifila TaxID=156173 RepID=A0A7S2HD81_9EUKA|mmetsp:Transcript_53476/g.106392  ORF Transcript_53476/g.106392 Transcript_53476/m.106392 type:complete len:318 (+) Transcript_53476:87-1040(+)